MHSDREAYLAKQIEILKKKERQQARKKNLWFAGGTLVIVGCITLLGYTLWSVFPSKSSPTLPDSSADISVEEITQPSPSLNPSQLEEQPTPVVEYGSSEGLDTLNLASDTLAPRR